jgi:hypothetical protein
VGAALRCSYDDGVRFTAKIFILLAAQAACAAVLGGAGGCDGHGFIEIVIDPDSGAGGFPQTDAGLSDATTEETPPPPDVGDAGLSPIVVGITPNPKVNGDGEPTAADKIEARLTTIAAGVRMVVVSLPWRDLAAGGDVAVASEIAFYEQHEKEVLFNLAFVDRKEDTRPDDLAMLAWDSPELKAAAEAAIQGVLEKFGKSLSVVTLGRDVDVFIDAHPDEREALEAFVKHMTFYTRGHPAAPSGLLVSAAVSFEGAAVSPSPSYEALLAASDVATLSYLPGVSKDEVAPASAVAGDLDSMIAASGGKPIVLQAVGYPSDAIVQSSPEKQHLFYETFWSALAPRRSAFTWINVFTLHDLGPAACEVYAAAQGATPDSPSAAFFCSMGLFSAEGAEKPAWSEVLYGTAAFASP